MKPDRGLRILHVTPFYEPAYIYGGPARSLPILCQALVRAGAHVTVMTTDANGTERLAVVNDRAMDRSGVPVHYFRRQGPPSVFFASALGRACRENALSFDLLHATGLWTYPSYQVGKVARRFGKPYVVSPRGMLMPTSFGHKAWKKYPIFYLHELRNLRSSNAIHCTTEEERRSLMRYGLDTRGFVIPNGLDSREFELLPPRGKLRRRLGISPEDKVLLYLGRLHAQKGIELTLAVFQELQRNHQELHIVFVGPDEGDYISTIRNWAAERNLTGRVHLTGALRGEERLSAYTDADLFLLLSESENFGMGAAEAMACGLPVVVAREVGISAQIAQHRAGIVVERDREAVVRAILPVLNNLEPLHTMRMSGLALVKTEFSADGVGRRMLEQYREIVSDHQNMRH